MASDFTCLLDTNILIQLEEAGADGAFKDGFAEFASLCHKHGIKVFYHPASEKDVQADKNETRRRKTLEWLRKYPKLTGAPIVSTQELERNFKGIKSPNDEIDCLLLYALKINCVDYLISQDSNLRSRASYANLGNRTYSIKEFVILLQRLFEPTSVFIPNVEELKTFALDRKDKIFESLRKSYNGFDTWLDKCNREHRDAWIVRHGERYAAICLTKAEKAEDEGIPELSGKILKLATFKVDDDFRGGKIGELLLKKAFGHAVANGYPAIYLTFHSDQTYLPVFLKDFGFQTSEKKTKLGEHIYFKTFTKPPKDEPKVGPVDFHIKYSPYYYSDNTVDKYIIPIVPQYHSLLFPEMADQLSLPFSTTGSIPGNTLKKVYICNSNTRFLAPGSMVFFYSSKTRMALTTIGVVEESTRTSNFHEAIRKLGKRSVYGLKEIETIVRNEALIIDFRFVTHLKQPIPFADLKKCEILKGPPVSLVKITEEAYKELSPFVDPNWGLSR